MFGGGGGLDPRKMEQAMKQMGIEASEVDAEEVIIRTDEHDLVFTDPDVTRMDARGQQTYQIVGSPEERERGAGDAGDADEAADADAGIDEDDVELVATRTGASEDEARQALEDNDGDLAAAVAELE